MSIDQRETPRSRELLTMATAELGTAGIENPRLEAEVMLAEALQTSRAAVLADSNQVVDDATQGRYAAMVRRRAVREPLAYIIGRKEFYSLELEVTPEVLIPRPETETLVMAALEWLAARPGARLLDLCTGSGAIALAIAANAPETSVVAADYSADALKIARRNASRLGLEKRVVFRHVDCFEILDDGEGLGRFDLVLSNPPYIRDADIATLQPEVANWEPRIALTGGIDGLRFYQRIAQELLDHLAPDGCAMIEIGDRQANAVSAILRVQGVAKTSVIADLSGIPRVIRATY